MLRRVCEGSIRAPPKELCKTFKEPRVGLFVLRHSSVSHTHTHTLSLNEEVVRGAVCWDVLLQRGPGFGTAAAAMQWQSQVSSLILTLSCGLIHCSAFRTLAYIYKWLTLTLPPSPPISLPIPPATAHRTTPTSSWLWGREV